MLRWISILGGLLIMLGHHARSCSPLLGKAANEQTPLRLEEHWCGDSRHLLLEGDVDPLT